MFFENIKSSLAYFLPKSWLGYFKYFKDRIINFLSIYIKKTDLKA